MDMGCLMGRIDRVWRSFAYAVLTGDQIQKYDMVVQSMIEMGVDIVYPVELPNQSSLTINGKNCFEPVVCEY